MIANWTVLFLIAQTTHNVLYKSRKSHKSLNFKAIIMIDTFNLSNAVILKVHSRLPRKECFTNDVPGNSITAKVHLKDVFIIYIIAKLSLNSTWQGLNDLEIMHQFN